MADAPKHQPGRHRLPVRKQVRGLTPPRAVGYVLAAAVTVLGISAAYRQFSASGTHDALPAGTVYSPPQVNYPVPALAPAPNNVTHSGGPAPVRVARVLAQRTPLSPHAQHTPTSIGLPSPTLPAAAMPPDLRSMGTASSSSRAATPAAPTTTAAPQELSPSSTESSTAPSKSTAAPTSSDAPSTNSNPPATNSNPPSSDPGAPSSSNTPAPLLPLSKVTGAVITIVNGL